MPSNDDTFFASVDFPFCVLSFLSWPTVDKCAASFESKSVARILHHIGLETILKSNSDSYYSSVDLESEF